MNIRAENTLLEDFAETSEAEKERLHVKFVEVSEQNPQLQELTLKHQELEKCNADVLNITSRKCMVLHQELLEARAAWNAVAEHAHMVTPACQVPEHELNERRRLSPKRARCERETLTRKKPTRANGAQGGDLQAEDRDEYKCAGEFQVGAPRERFEWRVVEIFPES